jgi:hypothetical protein
MRDHPIIVASKQSLNRFLARTESSLLELNASIIVVEGTETLGMEETVYLKLAIQNIGRMTWSADARLRGHVRVGVQLLDSDHRLLDRDYARQPLPHDVPPGHTVTTHMRFNAPSSHASYILKIDLVSEGVSWFEPHGSTPTLHRLDVQAKGPEATPGPFLTL